MKNPRFNAAALAAITATSGLHASPGGIVLPRTARDVRTHDQSGLMTFDQATVDASGAFLIGQLENFDPTLHEPLYAYTWSRDIKLRPGLSMGDDFSSWTASSYAAPSGTGSGSRKNWVGKDASVIPRPMVDIGKFQVALNPWAMEPAWTVFELEAAARTGQPIDMQYYKSMQMKWNMDTDEQVYVGDTALGLTGLVNSALVTNVANATQLTWTSATSPDAILGAVNELLTSVWTASGYAVMPNKIGLPPAQYALLVTIKVSTAGNVSLLRYLLENNIATSQLGQQLEIVPMKWLVGAGVGPSNRMIAYNDDLDRVRFSMVPLQRTAMQFQGIYQKVAYYGKLGGVEVIYPETIGYRDGI